MAAFIRGTARIDLVFNKLEGDIAALDRQIAWELSIQLLSRVSLRGFVDSQGEDRFRGEVLSESFTELLDFLDLGRELAARYPVGRVEEGGNHLGLFIAQMQEVVIRPFISRWRAEFLHWWEENRSHGEPFVIQNNYPQLDGMLDDWIAVRRFCRETLSELSAAYGFQDIASFLPAAHQQVWGD